MSQPHPVSDFRWHAEYVPQRVDFQFIKILVDLSLQQRLQLVDSIINLVLYFLLYGSRDGFVIRKIGWRRRKSQISWVCGMESLFNGICSFEG